MKRLGKSLLLLCFALLPVLSLGAQTTGGSPRAEHAAGNRLIAMTQRDDRDQADQDHRDSHGGLRITRALFGAGKHIVDVTSQLNAQIREGRLRIPVNNNTMGGDPYPNRAKTLTVSYTVDGHPQQVTLNEGDFLQLPPGEPEHDRDDHDHRGDDDRR
jgi:hypothetical protein